MAKKFNLFNFFRQKSAKTGQKSAAMRYPLVICLGMSFTQWLVAEEATRVAAEFTAGSKAVEFAANAPDSPRAKRFAKAKNEIEAQFPLVKHITIDEYLAAPDDKLIVDVRAQKEYQISRIPGAVHAATPGDLLTYANVAQANGQTLLVYCSLGWRSAESAQYLVDQKIDNVQNLHGSIFEWGNRHLPLENDKGKTDKVHPYNFVWGWLYLEDQLHAK